LTPKPVAHWIWFHLWFRKHVYRCKFSTMPTKSNNTRGHLCVQSERRARTDNKRYWV